MSWNVDAIRGRVLAASEGLGRRRERMRCFSRFSGEVGRVRGWSVI